MISMLTRRAVLAAPAILAGPALAANEVDVLLVLAADVSLSMTTESLKLQREAYIAALSDPGVIDVSGDGATNDGPGSSVARDAAIRVGVTVNGLPIVTPAEPSVATHYQEHVIGGPGAFMIEAHGIADVTRALRRKLLIELANAGEGRVA